jgi:hypothetical protein
MSPDPLRPPPPVGPRPRPPRTRGRIVAAVLALVAIGLPTLLLMFRGQPKERQTADATAETFVRALTHGSSPAEGAPDRTGFQAAHDLLADGKRDALPFDVFFDEWRRLTDSHGMIVDSVRTSEMSREWTSESRDVTYLLFLGGENQEHADLVTMEIKLSMAYDRKNRRFVISNYSRTHVPNPRATR